MEEDADASVNNDLLVLAKVADQAHSRILELPQEEEPEAES